MLKAIVSVMLVGGLLWQVGHATAQPMPQATGEPSPPEGEAIFLSEEIEYEIDREERDRYEIFLGTPGFLSAMIIQKPDGIYVAWVIYEKEGQRKSKTLPLTQEVVERLRVRVRIPPREIEAPERQTPETEAPERQASGVRLAPPGRPPLSGKRAGSMLLAGVGGTLYSVSLGSV